MKPQAGRLHDTAGSVMQELMGGNHDIGQLEAINNKIKLMAYGYHDSSCFLLKVKTAFR